MTAQPGYDGAYHQATRRTVIASMAASASGAITVYLVAALAVEIRSSLHVGAEAFGLIIACYYAGATVASIPSGRLAEAQGGTRTMRWSALAATTVLLLVAAVARSWVLLAILLFFGGTCAAAMQNSTNQVLARRISAGRQGLAFGLKQAAVPLSTVFAGLTVPALALTIGWRWAFAAAAALTLATAQLVPRPRVPVTRPRPKATRDALRPLRPLVLLTFGFGLGVFAASGLSAFVVTGAVMTGISKGAAGLLFAAAGMTAACSRVLVGYFADHRSHPHLPVVATMLAIGAIGYLTLADASRVRSVLFYALGTFLAYAAGWGWNGLFTFAVVRLRPATPGQATSVTQTGSRMAGIAGPLIFGIVVAGSSYTFAWSLAAGASLAGAGVMLLGWRLHRQYEQGPGRRPL